MAGLVISASGAVAHDFWRAADARFAEPRVRSETGMGAEAVAPRPA